MYGRGLLAWQPFNRLCSNALIISGSTHQSEGMKDILPGNSGVRNTTTDVKSGTSHINHTSQLAEKISIAFQAVSDDIKPLTPDDCFTTGVDTLNHLTDCYIISVSKVEHSLKKINVKKSVGPDNIPNWILHELAPWLAPPICAIWNSSFWDSYVPRLWKYADICLLPKVQPPMRVEKDLCPISLTPVLSKGMEWYAFTMDVIEDLIDTHQYGSVKGWHLWSLYIAGLML